MPQNQAKADPYLLLLGISPTEERTHYRLLDVPLFEPDLDVIEGGRNRRNVALRQIKDGPHLEDAERIKEEIATAFRLLCDKKTKSRYDEELKAKMEAAKPKLEPATIEEDPGFAAEIREQQIEQFRNAVREVFIDGIVEEHEKQHLQQLYPKLGINANEAGQIFGEIAKETQERTRRLAEQERNRKLVEEERAKSAAEQFRAAVREALSNGIIEEHQKQQLQQLYTKLGINANEAGEIYGEIAKETQQRIRQLAEQEEARQFAEQEEARRQQDLKATFQKGSKPMRSQPETAQLVPQQPQAAPASPLQNQAPPPIRQQIGGQPQPPFISTASPNYRAHVKAKINTPAVGLIACSLLNMLFIGLGTMGIYLGEQFDSGPEKIFALGFYGFIFLVYAFLFFGSISMYRLGGLKLARWTCGLSILLNITCFFLGPIFGIWGLIVLANKDVSACFRRR